jgi:CHAT domain-containing protein
MRRVYGNLEAGGMGTAAALREAQEWMRAQKEFGHPRHWAAWVLWGLPD